MNFNGERSRKTAEFNTDGFGRPLESDSEQGMQQGKQMAKGSLKHFLSVGYEIIQLEALEAATARGKGTLSLGPS